MLDKLQRSPSDKITGVSFHFIKPDSTPWSVRRSIPLRPEGPKDTSPPRRDPFGEGMPLALEDPLGKGPRDSFGLGKISFIN